jgi:hypothetical protein
LGAETVVDVWLHIGVDKSCLTSNVTDAPTTVIKSEPVTEKETMPRPRTEMKITPEEMLTKKENVVNDFDVQTTFIRCKGKEGGSFLLPVTVLPKNCQKRVDWNRPLQPQSQCQQPHQVRLSVELPSQQEEQEQQPQIKKKYGISGLTNGSGNDTNAGLTKR